MFEVERDGVRWRWHGGEYVEQLVPAGPLEQEVADAPGWKYGYDTLNVWDAERDRPEIARTQAAFERFIDEHLSGEQD